MHSLIREYYKREKLNERRGICELFAVGRSFQQIHSFKLFVIFSGCPYIVLTKDVLAFEVAVLSVYHNFFFPFEFSAQHLVQPLK